MEDSIKYEIIPFGRYWYISVVMTCLKHSAVLTDDRGEIFLFDKASDAKDRVEEIEEIRTMVDMLSAKPIDS